MPQTSAAPTEHLGGEEDLRRKGNHLWFEKVEVQWDQMRVEEG
jgi:hypothetical protein